jgi:peptidoglycan hydrolase CwlO-like protein
MAAEEKANGKVEELEKALPALQTLHDLTTKELDGAKIKINSQKGEIDRLNALMVSLKDKIAQHAGMF